MATGKRPDGDIFAVRAKEGELLDFPSVARGWGITVDGKDPDGNSVTEPTNGIPPMEWFNYLQRRTDESIQWLLQHAIPEWVEGLWPTGATVIKDGIAYRALVDTNVAPGVSQDWVPLVNSPGRFLSVQVFAESGTYRPSENTGKIVVEMVGGGGDASNISGLNAGEFAVGAGGGGGAYIKALIHDIADAYDVTVGAAGGMSLFGELLSVAGGSAGSYETGNAAMPEIIATATSHADLRYSEGVIVMAQMYGARGGYGYSVSDKLKFAGSGGGSPLGAGGEFSGDVHSASLPGSGYGAGGSGAVLVSTGPSDSATGGKGTPGVVIIYEYS